MNDLCRAARLADFQKRADFAPEDVYRHLTRGWRYILIHPFADEPEILARLGMVAENCTATDAWCEIDDDAMLLQIRTVSGTDTAGLWIAPVPVRDKKCWTHRIAVLPTPFITRPAFEATMARFVAIGFPQHMAWNSPPFLVETEFDFLP